MLLTFAFIPVSLVFNPVICGTKQTNLLVALLNHHKSVSHKVDLPGLINI